MSSATDEVLARRLRTAEKRLGRLHDELVHIGWRLPSLARESTALAGEVSQLAGLLESSDDGDADGKAAIVQPEHSAV